MTTTTDKTTKAKTTSKTTDKKPKAMAGLDMSKFKKDSITSYIAPEVPEKTETSQTSIQQTSKNVVVEQESEIQQNQTISKQTSSEVHKSEEESRGEESKGHKANVGRPSKIESLVKENIHVEGNHYYLSTHLNKQAADRLKYTVESLAAVDKDISNKVLVHIAINYLYDTFKTDLVKFKRQIDEARNASL